jgi:predicted transcriptional regulator
MEHTEEADLQYKKEIQNVLDYFIKEGVVEEISPGEYVLTEEGRKISEIVL